MGNAARCVVWLAVIALAACGGDDGATVDAPGGDAGIDAPGLPRVGSIIVIEYRESGMNSTLLSAGFGTDPTTTVSTRSDGPCQITQTTRSVSTPTVSAGTLSISGGGTPSVALTQTTTPSINYHSQFVGFRYGPNDVLTVNATGATVPAFSASVTFPPSLTVTRPTTLTMLSKAGLTVEWTPTTGTVSIFIPQYSTTPNTRITCDYDGAVGTATIPASALADLTPGMTANVSVSTNATTTSAAGPYELTFAASFIAFSAGVTVQP